MYQQNDESMKGLITTLQRMSIHDGPGIRTTVFFKGCNLRCKWCHNPETWSIKRQIQYIQSKCIHCGTCVNICPNEALSIRENSVVLDDERCLVCGLCAQECSTKAISIVGRSVEAFTLFEEIKEDKPYFEASSGGVTLSGGEPMLQSKFALELLELCKKEFIHTAIETNLTQPWDTVSQFLPWVDYWTCDFKLADSSSHKKWTGVDNRRVIENIQQLCERGIHLEVRTTIVPNVNDTEESVEEICQILAPYAEFVTLKLQRFHTLGFEKFHSLRMMNEMEKCSELSKTQFEELQRIPLKYNF